MSYDLHVFAAAPLEVADVGAIADASSGSRIVGDVASGGFVVERKMPGGFDYAFNVDGPLRADREDLPDAAVSAAAGIGWTYQLTVEGSAGPAIELARRFARELARRSDGVVYDPQVDAVVWPRGAARRFKPQPARKIDLVQFEWFVRREDATADLPALVFDLVRSYVPEALPRRFGGFEPLQGRLEEKGREGFVAAWHAEAMSLLWKGRPPCLGGSMAGLGDELIGAQHAGPHPVGSVRLSFDQRAFLDARWREDAVKLFAVLAERLPAFFAHADTDRNVGYGRGNVWYEADTVTNPGLAVRNVWMGLPSFPVWLAWFGSLYRPLVHSSVPRDLADTRGAGLLVRTSEMPASQTPAKTGRRRWPFSRGEAKEETRLRIPPHLVLKATGETQGAWKRERADFVPEGL
jgi:hypothetical protein